MDLVLESGRRIANPTARDLEHYALEEVFIVLVQGPDTFMQCCQAPSREGHDNELVLEFEQGGIGNHFQATGGPHPFGDVVRTMGKYLNGDESWRSDFTWERIHVEAVTWV